MWRKYGWVMPSLTRRTVSTNDTHAFLRHHQSRTVSWHRPQAKRRLDIFWAANWVHPWCWRGWRNLKTDHSHGETLIISAISWATTQSINARKKLSTTTECMQRSPCNIISIQGRLTWLMLMDPNPNDGEAGDSSEKLITERRTQKVGGAVGAWTVGLLWWHGYILFSREDKIPLN